MEWTYLVLAGLCEVVWAIQLKYTNGWTELWPSLGTIAMMAASFWFLSLALRGLPIGTAYAVWTGIGAVGTALIGMAFMGEPRDMARVVCVGMIVAGIVGLRLVHGPS